MYLDSSDVIELIPEHCNKGAPAQTAITWRYCDIFRIGRKRTDIIASFLKKIFEFMPGGLKRERAQTAR
jgi:hypothetical protein